MNEVLAEAIRRKLVGDTSALKWYDETDLCNWSGEAERNKRIHVTRGSGRCWYCGKAPSDTATFTRPALLDTL